MNNKKPYKTKIERDVIMHDDLRVSGIQGGKILGNKLALFSLIVGIPLLLTGLYGIVSLIFHLGFPDNTAIWILVLVVTSLGALLTIGGYLLYKNN